MQTFICKTCGIESRLPNKWAKRTYCSKSCKNKDPELTKKSNKTREKTWEKLYNGHPMLDSTVQQKHKNTLKNKYGVEHALQNQDLYEKVKKTKKEKYGNEYYNNVDKGIRTKLDKYGKISFQEDYHSYRRKLKTEWSEIEILDDIFSIDLNDSKVKVKCKNCQREWSVFLTNNYKPSCKICSEKYNNISRGMEEIKNFILQNSPNLDIRINDRKILNGYEIDLFFPDYSLGIEYNGIYYHSEKFKNKNYHLVKVQKANTMGISLIHISEYDWITKTDIVKSLILSKLNLYNRRFFARNTYVQEVKSKEKTNFLNQTHLQGSCRSSINLGLYCKKSNTLLSILTFGKPRYNSNFQYELLRYSSQLGTQVVGGFSKLLKFFLKNYNVDSLLTYADRGISSGDVYIKNGFKFIGTTQPGYSYVKNLNVYPRQMFQKHKLPELLEEFDPKATEHQNMLNNGYYRLYNSGNLKFSYSTIQ